MIRTGKDRLKGSRSVFPDDDTWALTGDIARMPIASVLQFLELGRHTGRLLCGEVGKRPSECHLQEGRIVFARYQHLVGADAVIATIGWKGGRFAFSIDPLDTFDGAILSASPLIMEAVRLEDELERIADSYPGEDAPLRLRNPHEVPTDPLGCGIDVVMATLAARDGASVRQLAEWVALAPIKIRIAAAWMASTNRLNTEGVLKQVRARARGKSSWLSELLDHFSGGLRVVVAFDLPTGNHQVIASIKALAKALDSGPAWISFALDGTSMARVRPRSGGLLSIACVPMSEEQRGSFERLASTADFVVICSGAPKSEVDFWETAAVSVPTARISERLRATCLLGTLKRFASALPREAPSRAGLAGVDQPLDAPLDAPLDTPAQ